MNDRLLPGYDRCVECDRTVVATWSFCPACGAALGAAAAAGDDPDDFLDHTDPDDLRRAYDAHETLTAAAEAFDVTYATVRKRMVAEGIYEPRKYGVDDSDDVDEDPDEFEAAGPLDKIPIDVPDHLTADDFEQAVEASRTLHEVCDLLEWDDRGAVRSVVVGLDLYRELPSPEAKPA